MQRVVIYSITDDSNQEYQGNDGTIEGGDLK